MQDLQGGRIDYLCEIITTAKPQIDGGTVKGLAILDSSSPALPNLPTAAEQGTDNLIAYTWNAIFLPKGAPEPIVKKLHDVALEAMHTASVRDRLEGLGAQIMSDDEATPQYLGNFVKSEIDKWAAPIKASGVSVDNPIKDRARDPRRGAADRCEHRQAAGAIAEDLKLIGTAHLGWPSKFSASYCWETGLVVPRMKASISSRVTVPSWSVSMALKMRS